jgi:hypothetical protein
MTPQQPAPGSDIVRFALRRSPLNGIILPSGNERIDALKEQIGIFEGNGYVGSMLLDLVGECRQKMR